MRYVVLDTETTGLEIVNGHRLIEIGCVEIINRKITGRTYHQYINPERSIDSGAVAVHGITQDFLNDKPLFADVADAFMAFIKDATLVIHNAPFDVGFIEHELKLIQKSWPALSDYCQILDTLALARQIHAGQRNSLDALCKRYHIDNSQRDLHGALLDANLLAKVYLAMTGGQTSLFGTLSPSQTIHSQINFAEKPSIHFDHDSKAPLVVILADTEELMAHTQKLQRMAEKGRCLWLEEV